MVLKHLPGMVLPRVPGHEVIGYVAAVGSEVTRFKVGDKVGRGWHGGHCFQCDPCTDGQFFGCTNPVGVCYYSSCHPSIQCNTLKIHVCC
jgi:D-arabinose 1-dehydrogenase-like Zn-dependent alcohol dehydrogenase